MPGRAAAGSRVSLLSASALERALALYPFGLPSQRTFEVRGTFELEPTYDESHVFVGLEEAQRLFRMEDAVSGIDLRLTDLDDAGGGPRRALQHASTRTASPSGHGSTSRVRSTA